MSGIVPINDLRGLLEKSKAQIAIALPRHLTPERMIRVALTAFQRTTALQECSPLSIVACVIQASELGLELTGPLGQAYMVPFYNKNTRQKEAQFIVGYRGFIDLAYRSGRVENFSAHAVHEADIFDYEFGSKCFLRHKPARGCERGAITDVYATLKLKGGGFDFEVMSKADVESHRAKYSKQSGPYSPWETAWEEMAKKTPIRRLAKRSPLSVEVARAAVIDEYAEAGIGQNLTMGLEAGVTPALPAPDSGNGKASRADALADSLKSSNGRHVEPPKEPTQPTSTEAEQPDPVPESATSALSEDEMSAQDTLAAWLDKLKAATSLSEVDVILDNAGAELDGPILDRLDVASQERRAAIRAAKGQRQRVQL